MAFKKRWTHLSRNAGSELYNYLKNKRKVFIGRICPKIRRKEVLFTLVIAIPFIFFLSNFRYDLF